MCGRKKVEFEEGKGERTEGKNKRAIGDEEGKIKLETKREQRRETTERRGGNIVHVFLIVFLHRQCKQKLSFSGNRMCSRAISNVKPRF